MALDAAAGWRTACLFYAAVVAGVTIPLHLLLIGIGRRKGEEPSEEPSSVSRGNVADEDRTRAFRLLAVSMRLMAMVVSVMSTMLIDFFPALGLSRSQAAQVAWLVGIAFFLSRLIELIFGPLVRSVDMAVLGFSAVILALSPLIFWPLLTAAPLPPMLAGVCAFLYGVPVGPFMILRATMVLELFGNHGYGHRMGVLYRPMGLSNATAPLLFSPFLAFGGGAVTAALLMPAGAALAAIVALRTLLIPKP